MAQAEASPARRQASEARRSPSAATDIFALSRVALKETLVELSAATRQTRAAASSAWRGLLLGAEAQLGIEVNIEDPALRELFGYLVQAEALLGQVRGEAASFLRGAEVLAEGLPPAGSAAAAAVTGVTGATGAAAVDASVSEPAGLAEGLGALARAVARDTPRGAVEAAVANAAGGGAAGGGAAEGAEEVKNVFWHTLSLSPNAGSNGSARYRAAQRIEEEVMAPAQSSLTEYMGLRERVRERSRQQQDMEECLREVAALQKSQRATASTPTPRSGLRPLMTDSPSRPGGSADERLKDLQARAVGLDEEVLRGLLEVRRDAGRRVASLWAALAKIREDFFADMAAQWAPVATDLAAGCGEEERPRQALAASPVSDVVSDSLALASPTSDGDGTGRGAPAEPCDLGAVAQAALGGGGPPAEPRPASEESSPGLRRISLSSPDASPAPYAGAADALGSMADADPSPLPRLRSRQWPGPLAPPARGAPPDCDAAAASVHEPARGPLDLPPPPELPARGPREAPPAQAAAAGAVEGDSLEVAPVDMLHTDDALPEVAAAGAVESDSPGVAPVDMAHVDDALPEVAAAAAGPRAGPPADGSAEQPPPPPAGAEPGDPI